ncbi:MAG: hypothetical protein H0Z40_07020 [Desulfotomaculum sp.]|nr:hypothetical protein [Desulfotomaculum sp.]
MKTWVLPIILSHAAGGNPTRKGYLPDRSSFNPSARQTCRANIKNTGL